jgi:hypothetical protein
MIIPNCVLVLQQQKLVSLETPHVWRGTVGAEEAVLVQLPAAEPRNILAVPLATQANSHQIYAPNAVHNHTSFGGNQQALVLMGEHVCSRQDMKHLYW